MIPSCPAVVAVVVVVVVVVVIVFVIPPSTYAIFCDVVVIIVVVVVIVIVVVDVIVIVIIVVIVVIVIIAPPYNLYKKGFFTKKFTELKNVKLLKAKWQFTLLTDLTDFFCVFLNRFKSNKHKKVMEERTTKVTFENKLRIND